MSSAALSIQVFRFYEIIAGIILICCPNFLFGLLKIPKTDEIWVYFVGVFTIFVGFYNCNIACMELEQMYWPTMYTRAAFTVFIVAIVFIKKAPKSLLLFALMDVIAMVWTCSVM